MDVLVTTLDDKEVTVLHSCVEVNAVGVEMFLQVFYQDVRFLRFQPTTGMVLQEVAFEADKVAAQGKVIVSQLHANAGSLQRSASFINKMLVVAEYAAVGHLATGMEAIGHGLQHTAASIASQEIGVWSVGILQKGLPSQCFNRPVGHAVG